jgi:hypothetical protein
MFVPKARLLHKLNGHADSDFPWLLANAGIIYFQQVTMVLLPISSPHRIK